MLVVLLCWVGFRLFFRPRRLARQLGAPVITGSVDRLTGIGDRIDQAPRIDQDVQFTVYRPLVVRPEEWKKLLVFAHRSNRCSSAPDHEPDPTEAVRHHAEQILGEQMERYQSLTQDSTHSVSSNDELCFIPEMAGVTFNPPSCTIIWQDDVPPALFHFRARADLEGNMAKGRLVVLLGSVVIAQIPFNILVDSVKANQAGGKDWKAVRTPLCRKIFASYSHKDTWIVEEFERYAEAFGDDYIRDIKTLRVGEEWEPRLLQLIEEAQIFQLFWSTNSMRSDWVRREYSHALSLNREGFVLPVYWEVPFPESRESGLPPAELRALQFHQIPPRRSRTRTRPKAVDTQRNAWETSAVVTTLQQLGSRVPSSESDVTALRAQLIQAGFRSENSVPVLYGTCIVATLVMLVAGLAVLSRMPGNPAVRVTLLVCGCAAGCILPRVLLRAKVAWRQKIVRQALPDALDLMVISVEAGLGLDQVIQRVSRELAGIHTELSEEMSLVTLEMRAGKRRSEALRNFAERIGEASVRKLASLLIQSDRFGLSLDESLRQYSDSLRAQRSQEAEEGALRLWGTVSVVFVLVLLAVLVWRIYGTR